MSRVSSATSSFGSAAVVTRAGAIAEEVRRLVNLALHLLRLDAVIAVVGDLALAVRGGDLEELADGVGLVVGVEDHPALHVARGAAGGLEERGGGPEEALLVRVEDRHQRDLGEVQPLAQQVDADEDVEVAAAEALEDLDALDGVDVGVEVLDPDPGLVQVAREVLGGALGILRSGFVMFTGYSRRFS